MRFLSPRLKAACLLTAICAVIALFWLGASPVAVGLFPTPWDKVAHFVTYSAITALLLIGTRMRWPIATLGCVVALGSCDELHQLWLPGRTADVGDLLVDVVAGVVTCALILHLHSRASVRDERTTQDPA